MRRKALLAVTLVLLLSACTPATISAFFAPCPEPTAEEWEAAQAEWLWSRDTSEPEPASVQTSEPEDRTMRLGDSR
jgi:hypothetical protein